VSVGLDAALLRRADAIIRSRLPGVNGFLVARRDRLVFERYYNGATRSQPQSVMSMTKPVVSTLVGIAIGEGRLRSVDERIEQIFPGRVEGAARRITLRDLLTMTAGYCCTPSAADPDDPVGARLARPVESEPGTRFSYDSPSSDLLADAVGVASGAPADVYARTRLFGPLRIRDFDWPRDRAGNSYGASGLRLRPRDLLAIGRLYLHGGRWHGRQIVPKAWVREARRAHARVTSRLSFGYDWWILSPPFFGYAALGAGGQALFVFPRLDLLVLVTGAAEKSPLPLARLVLRAAA
jgi:CubicO group peptidase (beta-lactamase class C family)